MNSIAHPSATPELQAVGSRDSDVRIHLRLVPRGDGWALTGDDGRIVFEARGVAGRRGCLQFARALGVLAIRR